MAIDESKLPLALPADVAIALPDGRATAWMLEHSFLQREWYKRSAIDLSTRLTEVKSQTDANTASIVEETIARTSADEAFASQITTITAQVADNAAAVVSEAQARSDADSAFAGQLTTVSATASGATAGGQVYITAEAAPAGYAARYGWHLTAGGVAIGMAALLDSFGNGSIAFAANQFSLTDPSYNGGAPGNVFSYSSGVFTFNVPVKVRTGDLELSAINIWQPYYWATDQTFGSGVVPGGANGTLSNVTYSFTVAQTSLLRVTLNMDVQGVGFTGAITDYFVYLNIDGTNTRLVMGRQSLGVTENQSADKVVEREIAAGAHTVTLTWLYVGNNAASYAKILTGSYMSIAVSKR